MKAGNKVPRLSERLNQELDEIRREHVDLMASQLQSLQSDIETIVSGARTIIEADMNAFVSNTQSSLDKQRTQMRLMLWSQPWTVLLTCFAVLVLTLAASLAAAEMAQRSTMSSLGISRTSTPQGTFLLTDPGRTDLKNCTLNGRIHPCILIKED